MKHTGTVELETQRLILRRFRADDADKMFENWAGSEKVTAHLPWAAYKDAESVKDYLRTLENNYSSPSFYDWCIVLKETGEPIGSIGAVGVNDDLSSIGLGYCLSERYWGQGIVPEAGRAVLKLFFETLGAVRVSAAHHTDNPKSGRVMQKLGMRPEGILRKNAKDNKGNFVDVCVYSMTDDDWFKKSD